MRSRSTSPYKVSKEIIDSSSERKGISKLLSNSDPAVSEKAHLILGRYGPSANSSKPVMASRVSALVAKLKDPDHAVQVSAAQSLGHLGAIAAPAAPALMEAAMSAPLSVKVGDDGGYNDYSLQKAAVGALGKIGPAAGEAVPTLVAIIRHKDIASSYRELEYEAVSALGHMGAAASPAVPLLAELVPKDGQTHPSFRSVATLVKLGRTAAPALPSLMTLIKTGAPYSNTGMCDVVSILKAIGPQAKSALPALKQWLFKCDASKDVFNRRCVIEGIICIDTDPASRQEFAEKFVHDWDDAVRQSALKFISQEPQASTSNIKLLLENFRKGVEGTVTPTGRLIDDALIDQSIVGLGNAGPAALEALPLLVHCKNTMGFTGGYFKTRRTAVFEAIKKIDPDGSHTIPIIKSSLALLQSGPRGRKEWDLVVSPSAAEELLDFIGTSPCRAYAAEIKQVKRW